MCGQCGVFSQQFGETEFRIFRHLLMINSFRGIDSTGVIRVDKKGNTEIRKAVLSSPEFLTSPDHRDILYKVPSREFPVAMIGHTRSATVGSVTLENSHPFRFTNVVGSHNGTITPVFKNKHKFGTDSEAFYALLNEHGIEEALNEIQGYTEKSAAYAFQYVDLKNKTLNFVRNTERPFAFTYLYNRSTLVWSSEKEALQFVLRSLKLDGNVQGWKTGDTGKYFTLNANDLMFMPLDKSPVAARITHLDIKKKDYSPSTFSTSKAMTTTSSISEGGGWEKTAEGWKLRPQGPTSRLTTVPNTKNTSKNNSQTRKTTGHHTVEGLSADGSVLYQNYKDQMSGSDLKQLAWLRQQKEDAEAKKAENKKVHVHNMDDMDQSDILEGLFRQDNFKRKESTIVVSPSGAKIGESEFRHKLSNHGCLSCGVYFNLDDPHDIAGINALKWGGKDGKEYFACEDCYNESTGDWVHYCITPD